MISPHFLVTYLIFWSIKVSFANPFTGFCFLQWWGRYNINAAEILNDNWQDGSWTLSWVLEVNYWRPWDPSEEYKYLIPVYSQCICGPKFWAMIGMVCIGLSLGVEPADLLSNSLFLLYIYEEMRYGLCVMVWPFLKSR